MIINKSNKMKIKYVKLTLKIQITLVQNLRFYVKLKSET